MRKSICGADCESCELHGACNGCLETDGRPFGAECVVAVCCQKGEAVLEEYKNKLIAAFQSLGIEELQKVEELYMPLEAAFSISSIRCRAGRL